MSKKKRNKHLARYMTRVAEGGCIVCGCPAQLHHPRQFAGVGLGQKASDWLVIPLCPHHHAAIHQYGNIGGAMEHDLLALVIEREHF